MRQKFSFCYDHFRKEHKQLLMFHLKIYSQKLEVDIMNSITVVKIELNLLTKN